MLRLAALSVVVAAAIYVVLYGVAYLTLEWIQ